VAKRDKEDMEERAERARVAKRQKIEGGQQIRLFVNANAIDSTHSTGSHEQP